MRVLHLPTNIASQMSVTVRALNDIGMQASGLVRDNSSIQDARGLRCVVIPERSRPLRFTANQFLWWTKVLTGILQSDVIHWHFGQSALYKDCDLRWARWLRKKCIVEFWGSDIRIPEVEAMENPYYATRGPHYEYGESRENSYACQEKFQKYGIDTCIVLEWEAQNLKSDTWQHVHHGRQRIIVSDFTPLFPPVRTERPLIVHSPSARVAKGTEAVERAIGQLRARYDFDFMLIEKVSYPEAQRIKQRCDLFLDQFVLGSYGLAAVEAMAMGKPVVCYLKPQVHDLLPRDCPVISATKDNLVHILEPYIRDARLRHSAGIMSRKFAENYHDAHAYARQLKDIYRTLAENKHA